jgi:hypothetical protein
MLLLVNFQAKVLEYMKSMPKVSKGEDLDFKVWGKGFCGMMVCCTPFVKLLLANKDSIV